MKLKQTFHSGISILLALMLCTDTRQSKHTQKPTKTQREHKTNTNSQSSVGSVFFSNVNVHLFAHAT